MLAGFYQILLLEKVHSRRLMVERKRPCESSEAMQAMKFDGKIRKVVLNAKKNGLIALQTATRRLNAMHGHAFHWGSMWGRRRQRSLEQLLKFFVVLNLETTWRSIRSIDEIPAILSWYLETSTPSQWALLARNDVLRRRIRKDLSPTTT